MSQAEVKTKHKCSFCNEIPTEPYSVMDSIPKEEAPFFVILDEDGDLYHLGVHPEAGVTRYLKTTSHPREDEFAVCSHCFETVRQAQEDD